VLTDRHAHVRIGPLLTELQHTHTPLLDSQQQTRENRQCHNSSSTA
jgi:hypothetical protein